MSNAGDVPPLSHFPSPRDGNSGRRSMMLHHRLRRGCNVIHQQIEEMWNAL